MDATLRKTLVVGILLVSVSFAWHFLYYLPRKERASQEFRDKELLEKQKTVFRQECKKEKEDDFEFFDKNIENEPSSLLLVRRGLESKGYVDASGNFINDDVWIRNCVEGKLTVWKNNN